MNRMRATLVTATFAVLLGTTLPAAAGELGASAMRDDLASASTLSTPGLAMTGGRVGTRSIRAIARDKGLALLALIGRHLDSRLQAGNAEALHLNNQPDTLNRYLNDDMGGGAASRLRNHLLGFDASFALGGHSAKGRKSPLRASIAANPKRVRITFKYRW